MLTSIQIAGLQTFGYHGLFEDERRLGQKFSFDIDATLTPTPSHRDDRLDASIRYDAVVDAAVRLASELTYKPWKPSARPSRAACCAASHRSTPSP